MLVPSPCFEFGDEHVRVTYGHDATRFFPYPITQALTLTLTLTLTFTLGTTRRSVGCGDGRRTSQCTAWNTPN